MKLYLGKETIMNIIGAYNTAVCYASVIEQAAIDQIRAMCDQPFSAGAKIRIMPDVHAGKGCTIGTTMTVTDKVVPNIVGVDIGCGMYTVELGRVDLDLPALDEVVHRIPSGLHVWNAPQGAFDLTALRCFEALRNTDRLVQSLGTLGGGNHFIEAERAADGTCYLVIHSGSRNLGHQVAEYYQKQAIRQCRGKGDHHGEVEALVASYRAQGRATEIPAAIAALKKSWGISKEELPDALCYLTGALLEDYLHDVEICQAFARQNRELMAHIILEGMGLEARSAFHTIHNYIDTDEMILRKGASAAHAGELVLIPINMRDGSILARGKGNPDWNYSAPHGAGRIMSRSSSRTVTNR